VSPEDFDLLERAHDYVVAIELTTGEKFFAEVVMVVNELPTPDVFLLKMKREADGAFVPAGATAGESVLLSDISRVAGIPGVEYPETIPE
jgi:hypothetical protein